jgi:cytosine/uracil/thiamine/allantoin permease
MSTRKTWFALGGGGLVLGLATVPARNALESSMAGQMLIQMPLLAMAGIVVAGAMAERWRRSIEAWNGGGLPGLLLASFVASYWMLPRSLDAALGSAPAEVAKFLSLPLLLGLPLALGWPKLHSIARGFVVANLISMLGVVGWLYSEAPVRLCNYYLVDQQVSAGRALIAVAVAMTGAWFGCALAGIRLSGESGAESTSHRPS